MAKQKHVLWFKDLSMKDVPRVGGKNASLGEMYRKLSTEGVRVPNGFATTADAYQEFLKTNGLDKKIKQTLKGLKVDNVKDILKCGKKIRQMIMNAEFSDELKSAILESYRALSKKYKSRNVDIAIRSSATAEDLPTASFAGQMESYLNVSGQKQVLEVTKKCFASLFTNRAIVYREEKGFDHLKISLSACFQKMVRSDLACSGVMFSVDTESGFDDVTVINSSWGLGENIVQGKVTPDEFMVFDTTMDKGFKPIIDQKLGSKEWKMVYSKKKGSSTLNLKTTKHEREVFTLTDDEILELAKYSNIIEDHYKKSMDMEWAKDGKDGKLYILQARPETVQSQKDMDYLEHYRFDSKAKKSEPIVEGIAVGSKIATGKVNVIMDSKDISKFKPGQVLVTDMTDPDWVPIMKIAKAIVTNSGGRVCHAAIVSRELGIPCIVGTGDATKVLKNGQTVTTSCAEGEEGYVYKGEVPFKVKKTKIKGLKKPQTKIMMNVGNPEQSFGFSFIPNDGVGLAREEFIINNDIGVHPLAMIDYNKINDNAITDRIDEAILGYDNPIEFYVDKLAEGIGRIGASFYPKDVIVRLADFKSNEYADLIGGSLYEPEESNPMIGWRGASRYYDPKYRKAFDLELQAINKVREEFGLDNIIMMVPFCRTIDEAKKVMEIIDEHGLRKSSKKLKKLQVYVMCEVPSNVILADEFAKIFDGFSIGSNDLTQLTLGVDRDSEIVSHVFDERNEAVKEMVRMVIRAAKKNKKKIGICGQAPSDFPEFAEFLVREGIDSISLNPDTVIETTLKILKQEKKLGIKPRKTKSKAKSKVKKKKPKKTPRKSRKTKKKKSAKKNKPSKTELKKKTVAELKKMLKKKGKKVSGNKGELIRRLGK